MQRPRDYPRRGTGHESKKRPNNLLFGIVLIICLIFIGFLYASYNLNHRYSNSPNIKLSTSGYCLDDYQNKMVNSAIVDAWECNSSKAQIWTVDNLNIIHDNNYCLGVVNNSQASNSQVVMSKCDGSSGQVWIRDKGGYRNPNSTLCLSASLNNPQQSLFINSCNDLNKTVEVWSPVANVDSTKILTPNCSGTKRQLLACYAEKQWAIWQSGSISHETLLNTYTDGSPYEEWCADFISYIYKEAGYPFTQGSANGWDENNANNIQYMGFTMHMASTGYVPKPGDIAFFSYNGGHVEIVISGGEHPTFIYGDSATIDPSTGNGQMETNTILGDLGGQLLYYLSPN